MMRTNEGERNKEKITKLLLEEVLKEQDYPMEFYYEILYVLNYIESKEGRAS
ncbi:hypothetical protein [Bacillus cereus]|uniref:hypothetical protein n=1 Tax=Bacillus cereus group TaxID=86661 RepID=UPI00240709DE|nr:hypothetical protein [Bacillus cereus]MDF9530634.1 hypothetical protein [Bacillus cereus]MDG1578908.1 hypothetical protein [Bacillus cereus]